MQIKQVLYFISYLEFVETATIENSTILILLFFGELTCTYSREN